jgi:membrane protein implicated in regulation of membrane protease activity
MPASRSAGQLRLVLISLPAGFLLLAGGGVALAVGERALGACLIVLALLTVFTGLAIMIRVKSVTMRQVQALQDRQRDRRPPFQ